MSDSIKNPAVIGAFVVGAVVLAVIGVILFGGGKMFQKKARYVSFFDESTKGLNVGAPVTWRGVKVGSVIDVSFLADPIDMVFHIPVVIEIEGGKIEATAKNPYSSEETLSRLIEKGLRARLATQSIVTGQRLVNLEILPDEPSNLSGIANQYPEIPTVASERQQITQTLEELPFKEIFNKLLETLTAANALLESDAVAQSVANIQEATANAATLFAHLDQTADHADQLILNVDGEVQPLSDDAGRALKSTDAAMRQIRQLAALEQGPPAEVAESIRKAADAFADLSTSAEPAVANVGKAFANVADMTDPEAKERYEMQIMLKELSAAARSIRVWSTYLELHPEAFIKGKVGSKRR